MGIFGRMQEAMKSGSTEPIYPEGVESQEAMDRRYRDAQEKLGRKEGWINRGGERLRVYAARTLDLKKAGPFSVDVVGESNYVEWLTRIVGTAPHPQRGANVVTWAGLVLENDNPMDSQAVAVWIGLRPVGYLSREDARRYRAGKQWYPSRCHALIRGGGILDDGNRAHFGVLLDIPLRTK